MTLVNGSDALPAVLSNVGYYFSTRKAFPVLLYRPYFPLRFGVDVFSRTQTTLS